MRVHKCLSIQWSLRFVKADRGEFFMRFFRFLSVSIAVVSFASCDIFLNPKTLTDKQAAQQLQGLQTLLPTIQAGLTVSVPSDPTARALTPSSTVTNSSGVTPVLSDSTAPGTLYTANGGTGSNTVRFPTSTSSYYTLSNGDKLFFTLAPDATAGTGYYRMKLTTYPAADFSIASVYEEYIVNTNGTTPWPWANLNTNKAPYTWVKYETNYVDGTKGTKNVISNSNVNTNVYYPAFAVAEPLSALTTYVFDGNVPTPTTVSTGMSFSSYSTETLKGSSVTSYGYQFYTETSATVHSGSTYTYVDRKGKRAVDSYITSRFEEDTTAGTKKLRALTATGSPATVTRVDAIDISKVSGKIVYSDKTDIMSAAPESASLTDASRTSYITSLNEGSTTGSFTGTMDVFYGSSTGDRYNLTATRSGSSVTVNATWASTTTRALSGSVSLSLGALGQLSVQVPGTSGTFTGKFEQGMLSGTYTSGTQTFSVFLDLEGVAVGDVYYSNSELK